MLERMFPCGTGSFYETIPNAVGSPSRSHDLRLAPVDTFRDLSIGVTRQPPGTLHALGVAARPCPHPSRFATTSLGDRRARHRGDARIQCCVDDVGSGLDDFQGHAVLMVPRRKDPAFSIERSFTTKMATIIGDNDSYRV
jgi:hypothetical protein